MRFGELKKRKESVQRYTVPVHGSVVPANDYDLLVGYCRELGDELAGAIHDATVLVHCYDNDNRPPMDILKRYGSRRDRHD